MPAEMFMRTSFKQNEAQKLESKRKYDRWKQPSKRTGFWEDGKWRDETSQSLQATKSFVCDKLLES